VRVALLQSGYCHNHDRKLTAQMKQNQPITKQDKEQRNLKRSRAAMSAIVNVNGKCQHVFFTTPAQSC
jgi:hypothetical protein